MPCSVDRTADFVRFLFSEAKVRGLDDADVRRERAQGSRIMNPSTTIVRQCSVITKRLREKKSEVESLASETQWGDVGFSEGEGGGGPNDALEELEALEIESLAQCSDYDRSLMDIRRSLGSRVNLTEAMSTVLAGGKSVDETQQKKFHFLGMLQVVQSEIDEFSATLQLQKKNRRRAAQNREKRRAAGTFGAVHLTKAKLQELQQRREEFTALSTSSSSSSSSMRFPSRFLQNSLGLPPSSSSSNAASGDDEKKVRAVDEAMLKENAQLQKQLENESVETKDVSESKLLDMSVMMTAFNQKVLEQSETVAEIMETEETARIHTRGAVKQLQDAADRGRNQSVWLLSILYLSAFSVLFLDWYGS
mmetsp:Transcript_1389/g.2214  ORF Transcript_1389/g.2214 Transcript_1389/m.2214 type:complete len:364 (+) Transcript_1389:83-1174(+)